MDIDWIKENETNEGIKNILNSNEPKVEENTIDLSSLPDVDFEIEKNEFPKLSDYDDIEPIQINATPLEFTDYAKSLMEKYHANDYHRMMNVAETNRYINLYSEVFNVNRKDAIDMLEDTINKQLTSDKSEIEIQKQGLEQQKLNQMTSALKNKYGNNFMAYANGDELEDYSVQYLHSYNVRRSNVDKMYEDSLNSAFADAIIKGMENNTIDVNGNKISNEYEKEAIQYSKNMGFSIFKLFLLTVSTFLISVVFIGLYFVFK